MKQLTGFKQSAFTRWASFVVVFAFLFCVFSGVSQSVYGALNASTDIVSCCPSDSNHVGDMNSKSQHGVCGSDKLAFSTTSDVFYVPVLAPLSHLDLVDLEPISLSIYDVQTEPNASLDPPLFILRFGVHAPPLV